ncbi:MAG TPA: alpha/beta hydrolase-fold protein, partial [Terriglobales bacterium]|nr:alpha/beta hydrolase-fold protein [Terriglobales bacterium]
AEDLIRRGEMEPIILVAIDQVNGTQRFVDYAPWPDSLSGWPWPNGRGDFYLRAVRDTLKPAVDRRYRTLTGPANTAMMGLSLGGLISVYAGFAYDSTFGKVAGMSPSYWWDGYEILDFALARGRPPLLTRFYQDTGTGRDYCPIGPMADIAPRLGFVPGVDFLSLVAADANHDTGAWQQRSPGMLRFLFPPR